jgi:Histidine kinase-, DNA gyrase B-, and HSP90-like ATPase
MMPPLEKPPVQPDKLNIINASPTKDFFISILVRDITLVDAIADLVDNCVDGARRLRPELPLTSSQGQNKKRFEGLTISIKVDLEKFTLIDTCGGMTVAMARDYAFRFGRPTDMPRTPGSVGQFGVGMKRALFKIGDHFCINSSTENSNFEVDVDVVEWKSLNHSDGREKWEFEFKSLSENLVNALEKQGTEVTITKLHPSISADFTNNVFINRLCSVLQSAHEQSIKDGLEVTVNNIPIQHNVSTLLVSTDIKPFKIIKKYPVKDSATGEESEVTATILAGVSETNLSDAGWSIICNGRQVLRADKSKVTGWDDVVNDEKLPKAHYQFARFRGYVFFESALASTLPWNTTKNAVDPDSLVYKATKQEMGLAMRQVIDFLNKLDAETGTENTFLQTAISQAKSQPLADMTTAAAFVYPSASQENKKPSPVRITFLKSQEEVEFAKTFFKITSAKAVGESVFDYFYEREST